MSDPNQISVLMPVYNAGPYLIPAVESILSQTHRRFEFVLVNDGSTDGSGDVLARYAASDPRVRLLSNDRNSGIVTTLNRGLQACSGDYIVRMDADDIALPDRIEKQLAFVENDPSICLAGAALTYMDAAGNDLGVTRRSAIPASWLQQNTILHPTVILKRDTLIRNGLRYQEKYRYAEDYYLWIQMSQVGRIAVMNDVVLKYRLSAGASRVRQLKGMLRATLRTQRDAMMILGLKPTPSDLARVLEEAILLLLPARFVLWMYLKTVLRIRKPVAI